MNRTIRTKLGVPLAAALAISGCQDAVPIAPLSIGPTASLSTAPTATKPFVYVTNDASNTVSVIATATNTVVATVGVGSQPIGIAITPNGGFAYVTNFGSSTVSVIATATNTVVATVGVPQLPWDVAITPDGAFAYVLHTQSDTISVIATASNTVVARVPVGAEPTGVTMTPDGAFAYVAVPPLGVVVIATATKSVVTTFASVSNALAVAVTPDGAFTYVTIDANYQTTFDGTVSVIATATHSVVATAGVGVFPFGIAITPNGAFAYVSNELSNTVSVIATATNSVVATVGVGPGPFAAAITPDGAFAYVPNDGSSTVSVIATATNTVVATIAVGAGLGARGLAILAEQLPVANAGPPVSGAEGTPVIFDGTGSSGSGTLTYSWNFGDGTTIVTGPTSSHVYTDNGTFTITLTLSDGAHSSTATTTATIGNVAPTATFLAAPDLDAAVPTPSVIEGTAIKLGFSNPTDPSPVDVAAGFQYAFDCGTGYGPFSTKTRTACPTVDNEQRTVRGQIRDKDGGVTEYTRVVTVVNQKPHVILTTAQGDTSHIMSLRVVSGTFTDPGVLDAPWSYSVSWGDGSSTAGTTSTQPGRISSSHAYMRLGKFAISMTVTDKDGGTGKSNSLTIQVVP